MADWFQSFCAVFHTPTGQPEAENAGPSSKACRRQSKKKQQQQMGNQVHCQSLTSPSALTQRGSASGCCNRGEPQNIPWMTTGLYALIVESADDICSDCPMAPVTIEGSACRHPSPSTCQARPGGSAGCPPSQRVLQTRLVRQQRSPAHEEDAAGARPWILMQVWVRSPAFCNFAGGP